MISCHGFHSSKERKLILKLVVPLGAYLDMVLLGMGIVVVHFGIVIIGEKLKTCWLYATFLKVDA